VSRQRLTIDVNEHAKFDSFRSRSSEVTAQKLITSDLKFKTLVTSQKN